MTTIPETLRQASEALQQASAALVATAQAMEDAPAPWDPTCLDRNGWIRSRLPTVEDTGSAGGVLIPVGHGGITSTIAYHLIVPGQPWAPWGSNPGRFEK